MPAPLPRRLLALGSLAVLGLGGLAACSDDDDSSAAGEGFCDALVAFNGAATTTELDEESSPADVQAVADTISPLWQDLEDAAPDDLDDEMAPLDEAVTSLVDGDAETFNSEETRAEYGTFVSNAVGECDFPTHNVKAVDYAFEDMPETLEAGTVVINLENASGSEDHELVAFKKNDPNATVEEIFALPEEEVESAITFAGAVGVPAGEVASSIFEFDAGNYVAVCFLPVGGQETGAPHFTEGMVTEFTVA